MFFFYLGDSINTASKLGEDIAQSGQIYVTKRAMGQLKEADTEFCELVEYQTDISGVNPYPL